MSTVRMCDRDGTIFSERADGWSSFTGATVKRDKDTGKTTTIQDTLDLCPECTELQQNGGIRPQPPLGSEVRGQYETKALDPLPDHEAPPRRAVPDRPQA